MKYLKNTKLILLLTCIIIFTSCGNNDDNVAEEDDAINCGSYTWTTIVQSELETWLTATQNFAIDQSAENCNAFKKAGFEYIEALENAKDCIPTAGFDDYEEEIKEAKLELSEFDC